LLRGRFRGARIVSALMMGHHRPFEEGRKYSWNVGKLLTDYTTQHPRRQSSSDYAKFEAFVETSVKMKMTDHSNIVLCCLVGIYQRFRGAYCLHHQSLRPSKKKKKKKKPAIIKIKYCKTHWHSVINHPLMYSIVYKFSHEESASNDYMENPVLAQTGKQFPVFNGTRRFTALFRRGGHWSLYWAKLI
jgi:hypothetical protein